MSIKSETYLHWFIWRSQFMVKLNNFNLATAFWRNVSGWATGVLGIGWTIESPVGCPSLRFEWLLVPDSRLNIKEHIICSLKFFFVIIIHKCYPSRRARLFLLRRPTCGCIWTCCLCWLSHASSVCTFKNRFTFSILPIFFFSPFGFFQLLEFDTQMRTAKCDFS